MTTDSFSNVAERGYSDEVAENSAQDPGPSRSNHWRATVEDEVDEEMMPEPDVRQSAADQAMKNAEEAAVILNALEEKAQGACQQAFSRNLVTQD